MREKIFIALLFIVGLINFAPLAGVVSTARLESMYGIVLASPEIGILMRHRALLFGIVGGFILCAAFVPAWRLPAIVMGFASMLGFTALIASADAYNEQLLKVAFIDALALVLLCVATLLYWLQRRAMRH